MTTAALPIEDETEDQVPGKRRRLRLPSKAPAVLLWTTAVIAAGLLGAVGTELVRVVIALEVLPWWLLLIVYSFPAGAAFRARRDAVRFRTYLVHTWNTYARKLQSFA